MDLRSLERDRDRSRENGANTMDTGGVRARLHTRGACGLANGKHLTYERHFGRIALTNRYFAVERPEHAIARDPEGW